MVSILFAPDLLPEIRGEILNRCPARALRVIALVTKAWHSQVAPLLKEQMSKGISVALEHKDDIWSGSTFTWSGPLTHGKAVFRDNGTSFGTFWLHPEAGFAVGTYDRVAFYTNDADNLRKGSLPLITTVEDFDRSEIAVAYTAELRDWLTDSPEHGVLQLQLDGTAILFLIYDCALLQDELRRVWATVVANGFFRERATKWRMKNDVTPIMGTLSSYATAPTTPFGPVVTAFRISDY